MEQSMPDAAAAANTRKPQSGRGGSTYLRAFTYLMARCGSRRCRSLDHGSSAAARRLRAVGAAIVAREEEEEWVSTATLHSLPTRRVSLPVVDLRSSNAPAQLHDACTRVGFQLVVGHDAEDAAAAAAAASEQFIANATRRDVDELRAPTAGYRPGFQAPGHLESEGYHTEHGEYRVGGREDFVVAHPDAAKRKRAGDPYYNDPCARVWYGDCENRFPEDGVWRTALERYYYRMETLSQRLLGLCGEVLAADLQPVAHRHTTKLVVAFHDDKGETEDLPVQDDEPLCGDKARTSVTGHSDSALFTLIHYGSFGVEGLELQDQQTGEWHRVSSSDLPPGALVLNIGDAMRHLSNGRFLSTSHRVVDVRPETEAQRERRRMALIYFFAPAYDVPLFPLGAGSSSSCAAEEAGERSLLGGLWTHAYRVAPREDREAFDQWRQFR